MLYYNLNWFYKKLKEKKNKSETIQNYFSRRMVKSRAQVNIVLSPVE